MSNPIDSSVSTDVNKNSSPECWGQGLLKIYFPAVYREILKLHLATYPYSLQNIAYKIYGVGNTYITRDKKRILPSYSARHAHS